MYKRVNIETQERDQHSINQFPSRCGETSEETDENGEKFLSVNYYYINCTFINNIIKELFHVLKDFEWHL